jgi:hypothetical protein
MPYFNMSTKTPTGFRPWGFALQNQSNQLAGLRGGRIGRLRFYLPSRYPLPESTLGDFFPRLANIRQSPYTAKQSYGDPPPVYGPLNPSFYRGLGFPPFQLNRYLPPMLPTADPGAVGPVLFGGNPISVVANPTPVMGPLAPTGQNYSQIYAAQQLAAQQAAAAAAAQQAAATQQAIAQQAAAQKALAAASAAQVAASPSSQAAVATAPAVTAPSWFTDPNQELITGLPNWGLLAIAAGGAVLLSKGKK